MRTRPAAIATIVIAIGLALTTIGLARQLPYTIAGQGDRSTISADLWAHGTAISPAVVALVFVGLLAVIAMRPTRGGRRSAAALAVLAGAISVSGLAEPAQQAALLFATIDGVTLFGWAFHVAVVGLVLSCVGEVRRDDVPVARAIDEPVRAGGEPVAAGRTIAVREPMPAAAA